jgi:hypothetical protein
MPVDSVSVSDSVFLSLGRVGGWARLPLLGKAKIGMANEGAAPPLTPTVVIEKLRVGEFEVVKFANGKSTAWTHFRSVRYKVTQQNVGFVQCSSCGLELT